MIRVDELVRRYGTTTAVDGISFEISKGEVVGFLGPNGAGKTTTLKILAGFLWPSDGSVTIADMDVMERSLDCRRLRPLPLGLTGDRLRRPMPERRSSDRRQ